MTCTPVRDDRYGFLLNHVSAALLPYEIAGVPSCGYGFGLGSRVLLNVAESGMLGSVGEFGWGGAAKTYFWVDPQEELIGILMAQYMAGLDSFCWGFPNRN